LPAPSREQPDEEQKPAEQEAAEQLLTEYPLRNVGASPEDDFDWSWAWFEDYDLTGDADSGVTDGEPERVIEPDEVEASVELATTGWALYMDVYPDPANAVRPIWSQTACPKSRNERKPYSQQAMVMDPTVTKTMRSRTRGAKGKPEQTRYQAGSESLRWSVKWWRTTRKSSQMSASLEPDQLASPSHSKLPIVVFVFACWRRVAGMWSDASSGRAVVRAMATRFTGWMDLGFEPSAAPCDTPGSGI
jgi:hypothetical protein